MAYHPINLALRFLLELAALCSFALWAWQENDGWIRIVLAVLLPLAAAAVWAAFAVPEDPSRSGQAPIPVPGALRLLLELSFFGLAAWMLHGVGLTGWAIAFGIVVVVHYAVSYGRIVWLIAR